MWFVITMLCVIVIMLLVGLMIGLFAALITIQEQFNNPKKDKRRKFRLIKGGKTEVD